MKRISLVFTLGLVLALVLAGCGRGAVDAGPVEPVEPEAPADEPAEEPADEEPVDEPEPVEEPEEPAEPEPAEEPSNGSADPAPAPAPDEQPAPTTVRLYFMAPGGGTPARADPFLVSVQREIPSTPRIALATLRELVDGPSAADRSLIAGLATSVPADTLVLGVTIADGVATVNLSREYEAGGGSLSIFSRLAQVVYTVTQWPTVDEVAFQLDGRPVTVFSNEGLEIDGPVSRADMVDLLPTVFVDTPAAGARIQSGTRVTGMAQVFEATFQYRLTAADGTVLAEGFEMSSNGMGWGSFDFPLRFSVSSRQPGTLTVWEYSAKDGSIQAQRSTPVTLVP
jgi:germination protein M